MVIGFLLSLLGGFDAIKSTLIYHQLDLDNQLNCEILDKYNTRGKFFPDLNFKCEKLPSSDTISLNVNLGEYEERNVGDTIVAFQSLDGNNFLSRYEIDNQAFIEYDGKGYSFVFIPAVIFFLVGVTCVFVLIRIRRIKKRRRSVELS